MSSGCSGSSSQERPNSASQLRGERRLLQVPLLVGVHHQHGLADALAHRAHAPAVLGSVGQTDLHLERRIAAVEQAARLVDELVDREIEPPGVRVVDRHVAGAGAAQELPERLTGGLREDVPERDVDRGLRHRRRARAPDPVRLAEIELLPDRADVVRVETDEVLRVERVDRGLDDAAAVADGDRVAGAGDSRVGRDREAGDLEMAHRLHAVGDLLPDRHRQHEARAST